MAFVQYVSKAVNQDSALDFLEYVLDVSVVTLWIMMFVLSVHQDALSVN